MISGYRAMHEPGMRSPQRTGCPCLLPIRDLQGHRRASASCRAAVSTALDAIPRDEPPVDLETEPGRVIQVDVAVAYLRAPRVHRMPERVTLAAAVGLDA